MGAVWARRVPVVASLVVLSAIAGCSDSLGSAELSLILTLRNESSEPIHLLLEGENSSASTLVAPGGRRTPAPLASAKSRAHSFRALGSDGQVRGTASCTVAADAAFRHNASLDWDGTQLTCVSGWQ